MASRVINRWAISANTCVDCMGRENGEAVLDHYTELKTVTVKLG